MVNSLGEKHLTAKQIVKAVEVGDDVCVDVGEGFGLLRGDDVENEIGNHGLALVAAVESGDVGEIALAFDDPASVLHDVGDVAVEKSVVAVVALLPEVVDEELDCGGERLVRFLGAEASANPSVIAFE